MMKSEFESRIGYEISAEDYSAVEYVYTWHPSIPDVNGKDKIAEIWKMGGIGLIHSMMESAKIAEKYTRELESKMRHVAELQKQINYANAEIAEIRKILDFYKF